ncbi:hypothetical protein [Cellulosimicrobium sp. Marseille-Q8652]
MQQHEHPQNITINADGSESYAETTVIESDGMLTGMHSGSTCVHEPARYTISSGATHNGSLAFQSGTAGSIDGANNGSLHVAADAVVEIRGAQNGSTHVAAGGIVRVAPTGRLAGSLHVDGLIENRGVREGTVYPTDADIRDLDGGTVTQPQTHDGAAYYTW